MAILSKKCRHPQVAGLTFQVTTTPTTRRGKSLSKDNPKPSKPHAKQSTRRSLQLYVHLFYTTLVVTVQLIHLQLQKKQQGGNRNESYGGNDNYDYASPQRNQRQDHTQQHQSGAAQSTAPSNTTGAAAADDPYAPWGGYQAYAQMYYAMLAQQQAASGQAGQSGAPGTS